MKPPSHSRIRIIGGQWRSRKINVPPGEGLRPTADRVRETLFNWLQNDIAGTSVLDLFAGSGACGLEALSRGARNAIFIDTNPAAIQGIRHSLDSFACQNAELHCCDALSWLRSRKPQPDARFGLVIVDPPYTLDILPEVTSVLESSQVLLPEARIYLESDREIADWEIPKSWKFMKKKRAGAVYFYLCGRTQVTSHGIDHA